MIRKLLILSAAALLAGGCADGTESAVATSMSVGPSGISMDAVGMTQVVRAHVRNQRGNPMPGAEIRWTTSSDGVTIAGLGGDSAVVTSVRSGTTSYTATSGSASATGVVTVAQTVATLRKASGDGQTGVVGTALGSPLRVVLQDRLGAPVPGVAVTFAVRSGEGTLSPASTVSDASGIASVVWTLGNYTSQLQQVSASAAAVGTVDFEATPVAGPAASADEWGGSGQVIARGTALNALPRVYVRDAHGNSAPGVAVRFAVSAGGGSVTGGEQVTDSSGMAEPGGWTVGTAAGVNTLTATFPGTVLPPLVFTAYAAFPGSVTFTAGDGQAAMAGSAVPVVPTVVVRDSEGRPLSGLTVTFVVTEGGGSVGNASTTTNASGVASVGSWTLGPAGATNRLKAQVREVTSYETDVRAVGCAGSGAGFTMTLCFTTDPGESRRAVFQNAAARWSSIIRADLPDARGSIPANACDQGMPSADFVYDDLVIFASIRSIDGPGGVLGAAGPCFFRAGSNLPFAGVMIFDAADVTALERGGEFNSVILHEMGHVLGIGTIWPQLGLLQNASSGTSRLDTYFSGSHAIAGFNEIGGGLYTGQKVPVENGGGRGTFNSHWRESVLGDELMTGFLSATSPNPLSVLTVRSLADLGYTVDASAADPFSLTLSLNATPGPRLHLHNDIYTGPRYVMDRNGRRTRLP